MTSSEVHDSVFNLDTYRSLLELATNNFRNCSFSEARECTNFVLWRHDIDFSLDAACRISKVDAAAGMRSTFFVNLRADTYNAASHSGKKLLNELLEDGHYIGVHVDLSFYGDVSTESELEAVLEKEQQQLTSLLSYAPQVFSFHNPAIEIRSFLGTSYAGMVNSYAPKFFNEVSYVSDSNGYWRFTTIEEVLGNPNTRNVQVLTHPEWWVGTFQKPRERLVNVLIKDVIRRVCEYDEGLEVHGRSNVSDYLVDLQKLKALDSSLHEVFSVLTSYGFVPTNIDWTVSRSSVEQVKDMIDQLLEALQDRSLQ